MPKDMKLIMEGWRQYAEEDGRLDELEMGKALKNIAAAPGKALKKTARAAGEAKLDKIFGPGFDPALHTIGDLKKAIEAMRGAQAGEELAKLGVDTLAAASPGYGNVDALVKGAQGAKDVIRKIYGGGDDVKTNTNLDLFNMNDDISKIVDDPIEVRYLNDLLSRIESEQDPDRKVVDLFDGDTIETDLQKFLATNFDQFTIKR